MSMSYRDRLVTWEGVEVEVISAPAFSLDGTRARGVLASVGDRGWRVTVGKPMLSEYSGPLQLAMVFCCCQVLAMRFPDDKDVAEDGSRLGPASGRWYAPQVWVGPR